MASWSSFGLLGQPQGGPLIRHALLSIRKENIMNLIHRERRTPAIGAMIEPFGLMRNLMRWDPFRDVEFPEMQGAYLPAFDIRETAKGYVFSADLPGVKLEDMDINLTGNRLTITGKRDSEERRDGENVFVLERSFGSFNRTFNLPEGVDPNGVTAELKNGVLTLTVPKVPEIQPKKITIQAS